MEYHPDKGGDPLSFDMLKRAYDILSDEEKRQVYDNDGIEGLQYMGEDEFSVFNLNNKYLEN